MSNKAGISHITNQYQIRHFNMGNPSQLKITENVANTRRISARSLWCNAEFQLFHGISLHTGDAYDESPIAFAIADF